MTEDEEDRKYVEESKKWYQQSPWKGITISVVSAAIFASSGWGLGLISKVETTAQAVERVPENSTDIDRLEREMQALREGQTQILDRLSELREDVRREHE